MTTYLTRYHAIYGTSTFMSTDSRYFLVDFFKWLWNMLGHASNASGKIDFRIEMLL